MAFCRSQLALCGGAGREDRHEGSPMDSNAIVTVMRERHRLPPGCCWNMWLCNMMGTFCCTGKQPWTDVEASFEVFTSGPQAKSDTPPSRPAIISFQNHHSNAMKGDYNLQDIFDFWDSQGSSQLPGTVTGSAGNAPPLPSSVTSSAAPNETPRALSQGQYLHASKLTFMQEADWDPEKTNNQDPPTCLHYSIEWKVTRNGRAFSRGTEPDIVLAPSCYWQQHLKAQVEDRVNQKAAESGAMRLNDTNIVVSVTERPQRDLAKHFPKTEIDWAVVET